MMGDVSGSERTDTGVPPEEPGRGLTEWKPLSLCASLLEPGRGTSEGVAERLPSEADDDEAGRAELAVPTMESMEKPILGLDEAGGEEGVTGGDALLVDFDSSIMAN